jgi:hypothetical protein
MPLRTVRIVATRTKKKIDERFLGGTTAMGRVLFEDGLSDMVGIRDAKRIAATSGFTYGDPEKMEELHASLLPPDEDEQEEAGAEEVAEADADVEEGVEEEPEDSDVEETVPESTETEEEGVAEEVGEEETDVDLAPEIYAIVEAGVPDAFADSAPGYNDLIALVKKGELADGSASPVHPDGIEIYAVLGSPNKAEALAAYYLIAGEPDVA